MARRGVVKRGLIFIFLAFALPAGAVPRPADQGHGLPKRHVAVVRSRYDAIDTVLDNFRIPYDLIEYRELEKPNRLDGYHALFVGSGADNPVEESLEVFARNMSFKSVSLKADYREIDPDLVARNIRRFIKRGGAAYFSGYSFSHIQRAFGLFEFFDDFPYMGMPSRIEASVSGDLARFAVKNTMALYLDHPGWVTIKSAKDAEVVARASFETPRGRREGPITVIARRGDGEILYTSYDSTVFSDFRRFNVYRIAGNNCIRLLEERASKWGQRVTCRIVDAIHRGEYAATYRIDLEPGENTIYFHSERAPFQIDIVDKNYSLIESRDILDLDQIFSVDSSVGGHCFIRLYPSSDARYDMYAVAAAVGARPFPYWRRVFIGLAVALALAAGIAVKWLFFPRKTYTIRWR